MRQHASRVLRILGVDDLIEDIIYCDYSNSNFSCKPETEFYENVGVLLQLTELC